MAGGDILAFLSCKGAVVDHEVHGNGRLGNLLERNGFRIFRRAEGIADVDVRDSCDCHDGADACLFYLGLAQSVKFIELADFYFFHFIRVVVVYQDNFLIHL